VDQAENSDIARKGEIEETGRLFTSAPLFYALAETA